MDEENIVDWGGITRLPTDPERIIQRGLDAGLKSVVIIGFDRDGDEFFTSSDADGGAVLWLIERAKMKLLRVPETHFGIP